jgi:hypothetical protein
MMKAQPDYRGVVTRIAYAATKRHNDHVTIRTWDGKVVACYRNQVDELGPQECSEPTDDVRLNGGTDGELRRRSV